MGKRVVVVISDIHIGAGPLDDCDAELEQGLTAFLAAMGARNDAVELVINGDFLDFIQAPPSQGSVLESGTADDVPLCFTQQQSCDKFQHIAAAHPRVFSALGEFLSAGGDHRLVVLPGNHDADFFWPDVRALFLESVTRSDVALRDRVRVHLEQVYHPEDRPGIWIEHGHQYDPCNAFVVQGMSRWSQSNPPIFRDRNGHDRLYECTGTRFLVRFLNRLDAEFPFVDNVKPFSKFLRVFGASALTPGYGPLKAAAMVWAMLRFLGASAVQRPGNLLGTSSQDPQDPVALLRGAFRGLSPTEEASFAERLVSHGYVARDWPVVPLQEHVKDSRRAEDLLEFLAATPEALAEWRDPAEGTLGLGRADGTLTLGKGFVADETQCLIDAATAILSDSQTTDVVMGHTHERVERQSGLRYVNPGSWTRYFRETPDRKLQSWSVLRADAGASFPYELNYVEVDATNLGAARLETFASRAED